MTDEWEKLWEKYDWLNQPKDKEWLLEGGFDVDCRELIKIKAEGDRLKEKADKYDAQKQSAIQMGIALGIPSDDLEKLGHSAEEIAKSLSWKEKAEKWDDLLIELIEHGLKEPAHIATQFNIDHLNAHYREKKLEAIKLKLLHWDNVQMRDRHAALETLEAIFDILLEGSP